MHFACGGWLKVAINLSMYFLHRQIREVMAVEITWGGVIMHLPQGLTDCREADKKLRIQLCCVLER